MRERHNTFLSRSFLRSVWAGEFEAFKDTDAETELKRTLEDWARRVALKETAAESALLTNIVEGVWGYRQTGGSGDGFTLHPKRRIKGGSFSGGTGEVDAALGHFGADRAAGTMQVAVELKGPGTDLDAPQARGKDRRTPVKQGLDYLAAARRGMVGNEPILPTWAIVTNMNEFRLYWWDRAPGQYLSFTLEQTDLLAGPGMLGDDEDARFERFLFARVFSADMLLTTGGKSRLEMLIGRAFVRQRDLEKAFYGEYRDFRDHLYRTLEKANPSFPGTKGQLVRLAQKLLDRAIFVFYCEDMGAALDFPPQLLRNYLIEESGGRYFDRDGDVVWSRIRALFAAMNDGKAFGGEKLNQFNGGLFAPDAALDGLTIPNSVFCEPRQGQNEASLYAHPRTILYLSAAYNYAADLARGLTPVPVADADDAKAAVERRKADPDTALGLYTLGRIFEQSITELEMLEAEAEGRVSVNKESGRKTNGVYYTPEWVVDRIVAETLGPRLADIKRTCGWPDPDDPTSPDPDEAAINAYRARLRTLTVLDPACGSGAFLITALKHLVAEWNAVNVIRERVAPQAVIGKRDRDELIADVLRENLYGVDINPASVEITQLALWLHTARGDRPLSSLDHHIRPGNSLVGEEFWLGQIDLALYDAQAKERVNTFDWDAAFPEVAERGGFDVVIGNPPYVKLQNFRKAHADVAEFIRHGRPEMDVKGYESAANNSFDLFVPFVEKGLDLLMPGGRLGYIAPSVWVMNQYGEGLRDLVERTRSLDRWLDFRSYQVFEEAITYTALQFFHRREGGGGDEPTVRVADAPDGEVGPDPWARRDSALPYDRLGHGDRWLMLSGAERALIDRLDEHCARLEDVSLTAAIYQGLITSMDKVYHLERKAPGRYLSKASGTSAKPKEVRIEDAVMHPLVSGAEAKRYAAPDTDTFILFPYAPDVDGRMRLIPADAMARDYPLAWAYLREHEDALRARESGKFDDDEWHRFGRTQNLDRQNVPKLIVAQTVPAMRVCFDEAADKYLNNVRVNGILAADGVDPWFLLGALNGPVADFVFRRIAKPKQSGWFEANKQFIAPLPVPPANEDERADIARRARTLQRLHTERRDALASLRERLDGVRRRERPHADIFPAIAAPADREVDAPAGVNAHDWAQKQHDEEVAAVTAEIEDELHPDVELRAVFAEGELSLLADGAPVIVTYLDATEGPFVAAQWNAALDRFDPGATPRGNKTLGTVLIDALRTLIVGASDALRDQVIELQGTVERLHGEIERAEADVNDRLATLYKLTPTERAMVEGLSASTPAAKAA